MEILGALVLLFGGLVGAIILTFFVLIARPLILTFRTPELLMLVVLGFSMVGNDGGHVREVLDAVVRDVEELYVAPVVGHEVRVVAFDDFEDPVWHGQGPDPISRELLAGDPGDEPEDEESIEDAPWALPKGPPRRAR